MISVLDQISRGVIVCPRTRKPLRMEDGHLASEDGTQYEFVGDNVPILLSDPAKAKEYSRASATMARDYSSDPVKTGKSLVRRLKRFLDKDYRTKESREAFDAVIGAAPQDSLCLSIGGGPFRQDPKLTNLNIGPFPNVDIVADAHELPYRDQSVDNIYCEAVLEHLEDPRKAVEEMWRVLKPGGKVIAITPFMQGFHGYPFHFQNFTVIGHALLFSKAGFRVIRSGTCVGPTFAAVTLITVYISEYFPKGIRYPLRLAWRLASTALTPLDLLLGRSDASHVLAAATYVLADKPAE